MILEFLFILTWGFGDLITTYIFLKNGKREGNPVMRYMLEKFGFSSLILIKIIGIVLVFVTMSEARILVLSFGVILGIILSIHNLNGEKIDIKNLFKGNTYDYS